MHDLVEFVLPLVVGLIALFPLTVLLITYQRTRSPRILIASLAFAGFLAKGIVLSTGFLLDAFDANQFEIIEFVSDLAIIILFATSLLWRSVEQRAGSG